MRRFAPLMTTFDAPPAAAPVSAADKARAEAELAKMKKALVGWMKYRTANNEVASGKRKGKVPPGLAKKNIETGRDWGLEQRLADRLHVLLAETLDSSTLPDPDVKRDPDAAVKLAQIAVAGKLPNESRATPTGMFWLWPAVVVVGLVMFTVVYKIRSDAETAQEKERLQCIQNGGCTDYGFWLKVGGVAVLVWLAWDKFGGREAAGRLRSRAGGTR